MSKNTPNLLKYHLDPLEENFIFQIVEQSDEVTKYLKRVKPFDASNGWRVTIDRQPEVDVDNRVIYLQGTRSKKDSYIHRNMDVGSVKEVKKICGAIDKALAEVCKAAKCGTRRPFKYYDTFMIDLSNFDCFPQCVRNDNRVIIVR